MKKVFYALTITLLFSSLLLFGSWQLVAASHSVPTIGAGTASLLVNPPSIAPPFDNKDGDPNSSVIYDFTLTNMGATTDTFFLALTTISTFPTIVTPTTSITLAASVSETFALQVDIPANALAGEAEHVVVITSTAVATPTHVTATTTINTIATPPTVVPPNTIGNVNPSQTITYTFTLTNHTNTTDTFGLGVTGLFPAILSSPSITVAGDDSQPFTLAVTVPSDGIASQSSGNTIHITPTLSGSALTVLATTTVNTVLITPQIAPPTAMGQVNPSETIAYTFTITNQSNLTDTFNLGATGLYTPTLTPITPLILSGYASSIFTLTVEVPPSALAGEIGGNWIAITPTNSPTPAPITTTTLVSSVYISPTLTPKSDTSNGDLGQAISYTFTLTNQSNITDTFTVQATGTWTTTSSPTSVADLGPNDSAQLTLTVTVPLTALAGMGTIATLSVDSNDAGSVQATATTIANEQFGIALVSNRPLFGVQAGEQVTVSHTVTNTGNGPQMVNLSVDSSSAITPTLSLASTNLAAGASQEILITYEVPAEASDGTPYTTTLTARLANHPTITSQATSTATVGLRAELEAHPEELTGEVYPSQIIAYAHTITNTGNKTDTVAITFSNTDNSFDTNLSVSQLTIAPGMAGTLIVSVTAPITAEHGRVNTTTVTITSGNDSDVIVQLVDTTTAKHVFLYLPLIESSPQWKEVWASPASDVRALAVAVCPTDNNIVFAGFSTGLWVKSENTDTFTQVESPVPTGAQALVTDISLNVECDEVYVSVYNHGIWKANRTGNGNSWTNWGQQTGGLDVKLTRAMVLANNTPVVGGDFGLARWDGSSWVKITGIDGVVMDVSISISNPTTNQETLYAVVWFQNKVWTADATTPANWTEITGLPEPRVISVEGNQDKTTIFVGTQNGVYRRINNNWVAPTTNNLSAPAYAFWLNGNQVYAGLGNNQGVHLGSANGVFSSINTGDFDTPPLIVYQLARATSDGESWLYAATTTGIWRYGLLND